MNQEHNHNTSDIEEDEDYVIKRDGTREKVSFDKILNRIKILGQSKHLNVNYTGLVMKIIDQIYNNIETEKIDEVMAQQCASMCSTHYDYYNLASYLVISNFQKKTNLSLYDYISLLYNQPKQNYISDTFYEYISKHHETYESMINTDNDYLIDYFGFKTLERAYLMKHNNKIIEKIQYMWMRVAIQIHGDDFDKVQETYNSLSNKDFIHATPTLFNSGTKRPQLSSCFLLGMEDDSINGIFNTLNDCASISKWAGGIGLHIHNIRAEGTKIAGTNGVSNGLAPMLRVFNNTARYVDQCLVPETYIYTINGPKQIQHLDLGVDSVYNDNGKVEVIQNVLEHSYSGDVLEIDTVHSIDKMVITSEHPVLSILNQPRGKDFKSIQNELDQNLCNIEYNEAKKINEDSLIVYSIPRYYKDNETISKDDCYIYGLMITHGYMNNKNKKCSITLSNSINSIQAEFVKNYLNSKFIPYNIENETILWDRSLEFPFKYTDFYDEKNNKRMSTRMLHLELMKVKQIIKGLIINDDCIHKQIIYESSSRVFIEQLKYLFLRMSILTTGTIIDNRKKIFEVRDGEFIANNNIYYSIEIPKTKQICKLLNIKENKIPKVFFLIYKNFIFTRVKSVNKKVYNGVLYDLQMKDIHNYTTHNGIVHNGGGKRNGSFAMYLEPWHGDIEGFLELKKNHGDEEARARDLFYALWIPDYFMKCVETNSEWYLMCPHICSNLSDTYGEEFEEIYKGYVEENKYIRKVKARDLWFKILDSQMETGTPYMLYKDSCNKKSNQKNLGTIKSSNLCAEIVEYSDKDESAVCNLASISLPSCIKVHEEGKKYFCFDKLLNLSKILTVNLNKIIDYNFYPTKKTEISNFKHRPIGIGVQGLADVFVLLGLSFDSDEARKLNEDIFETIYFGSITKSNELSNERNKDINYIQLDLSIEIQKLGKTTTKDKSKYYEFFSKLLKYRYYDKKFNYILCRFDDVNSSINESYHKNKPIMDEIFGIKFVEEFNKYILIQESKYSYNYSNYEILPEYIIKLLRNERFVGAYSSFEESPISKGIFQFDLWDKTPTDRYDWILLKNKIKLNGIRNSLCVALMPTASTSQILGNNECFEPFTSNIYMRRTLAGEFMLTNKYLIKSLCELNLWNNEIKNEIIRQKGSIQNIKEIPENIKSIFKIVWEIEPKVLIEMARDRGAYICQSQSMNLWIDDPNYKNLTKTHFYAWKQGLKTGIYYLRRKPKHHAQQFTVEPVKKKENNDKKLSSFGSNPNIHQEEEGCLMCSG